MIFSICELVILLTEPYLTIEATVFLIAVLVSYMAQKQGIENTLEKVQFLKIISLRIYCTEEKV